MRRAQPDDGSHEPRLETWGPIAGAFKIRSAVCARGPATRGCGRIPGRREPWREYLGVCPQKIRAGHIQLHQKIGCQLLFLSFQLANCRIIVSYWISQGFHGLTQLPFNGKKTKPAKLRKDYWSPLALIRFQPGQGSVGRSVFQKLRELKHLHEVAWTDELRHKRPEEYSSQDKKKIAEEKEKGLDYQPIRSKQERGIALNAQKKNAIADMASVLAGEGRGNKVLTAGTEGGKGLVDVTVSWANDQDKKHAESWSKNVTHSLFEVPTYTSGEPGEPEKQVAKTTA